MSHVGTQDSGRDAWIMEFRKGSPIRVHTKDKRTFHTDTYEWGELGIIFDFIQNVGNRKRALIPWSNILMVVTDLSDDDA